MIRHALILLALLSLASCARITQAPTPVTPGVPAAPKPSWSERQATLSKIQQFWLNGKIAVITSKDSGSANVAWSKQHSRYDISLTGPLGSHATKLSGQPGRVTLLAEDGKRYTANTPEELLATRWGYQLPISNMAYWVRGLPAPGSAAATQLDGDSRLQSLRQQGYSINYDDYTSYGNIDLPRRITISSNAMRVKLIIYQWRVS